MLVEPWKHGVLGQISLAFLAVSALMFPLIVNPCGFTQMQRIGLLVGFMLLMFLVLLVCTLLALLPGGALYSPYERSLSRGKRYGSELKPLTRRDAEALPRRPETPGVPAPGEANDQLTLPPGEPET